MHRPPKKKRPGDGPPGEPGEAEFRRDRAALRKRFPWLADERLPLPDAEEDSEGREHLAAGAAQARFFLKHRARLERHGLNVDEMLAEYRQGARALKAANRDLDAAIERELQAKANKAVARANLIEHLYGILLFWESRPESAWETLDPVQRAEQWQRMTEMRGAMPAMLAELDVERRRKLEAMSWGEFERTHVPETPPTDPPAASAAPEA